jgi:hypothetical protein
MEAEFVVSSISTVGTREEIHLTPKVPNAGKGLTTKWKFTPPHDLMIGDEVVVTTSSERIGLEGRLLGSTHL